MIPQIPGSSLLAESRWEPLKVAFVLSALAALLVLFPMAVPLLTGVVAAFVIEDPFERFLQRFALEKRRALCAFAWVAVGLLVFLLPLSLFLVFSIREAVQLFDRYQSIWLRPTLIQESADFVQSELAKWGYELSIPEILGQAKSLLARLAELVGSWAKQVAFGTPEGILGASLFVFAWFFFLQDGRRWRNGLLPLLIPWDGPRNVIAKTAGDVLRAVVISNLVVSLAQSFLVGIILAIAGIPQFLLLAGLAFFASFVPVVGTSPIFIFASIWCFSNDRVGFGIFLLIGMIVVGVVDNLLRPYLVKGGSELSFFWVFLAFVGGVSQFGVSGALLGPLALSVFAALLKSVQELQSNTKVLEATQEAVPEDLGQKGENANS